MDVADRGAGGGDAIRTPSRPGGFVTALKFFGPGAIIASVTIGSGEVIFPSRLGALFGYSVLWIFVVAAITKGAMVYANNRHIVVSGEHPMDGFLKRIPGPRGWFVVLMGLTPILGGPAVIGALATGLADYFQILGLGNARVWAGSFVVVGALLAYVGTYTIIERIQQILITVLILIVVAAAIVTVGNWGQVFAGLIPGPLEYQPFVTQEYPELAAGSVWVEIVVAIGAFGGGIYEYIGYASEMREKRWGVLGHREIDAIDERIAHLGSDEQIPLSERPEDVANARAWQRAPFVDVAASFGAVAIIAAAFAINGAGILGEQQVIPAEDQVLNFQAQFLGVIAPFLEYFYVLGVFLAFFGTVFAGYEIYSFSTYESLATLFERVRRRGFRGGLRSWLILYMFIFAFIIAVSGLNLITILTPVLIIGGALFCGFYSFGLLYIDRAVLPPQYRLAPVARALLIFAAVFLTISGAIAFVQYLGFFG
jgi:hypothetical protein